MKVDFTQTLYDLDGEPVENNTKPELDAEGKPKQQVYPAMRLGDACAMPLSHAKTNEKGEPIDIATAIKLYSLAARIKDSMKPMVKQPDLTSEDIVLIKAMLPKQWLPLIAGQSALLLEGKLKPKAKITSEPDTPEVTE